MRCNLTFAFCFCPDSLFDFLCVNLKNGIMNIFKIGTHDMVFSHTLLNQMSYQMYSFDWPHAPRPNCGWKSQTNKYCVTICLFMRTDLKLLYEIKMCYLTTFKYRVTAHLFMRKECHTDFKLCRETKICYLTSRKLARTLSKLYF